MDDNLLQIPSRIRELREILGIGTEEMAKKVGIGHGDYLQYESGTLDIPIGVLYGVAAALKLEGDLAKQAAKLAQQLSVQLPVPVM